MLIERRDTLNGTALHGVVPPLLERVYTARGISDPAQLQLSPAALLPPETLKGLPAAVSLLWDTLQQQGRVLVVSDFDADGATSCAVVLRGLRALGFLQLDYIVPDRFVYGYGLSPEIAELAIARRPDLIITVDNGISSHQGVALARAAGVKVLITDHHLPGHELPVADAIVNPNQPGCLFASKALAGVGVAFYVMLALRALLRERSWFAKQQITEPNLAELLPLVALGTIADLVPLDRNNRILVNEGLRRIRAGRGGAGIHALLSVAGRQAAAVNAADLAFAVGPRLNAAGRLEDMSLGIACLLTDDAGEADRLSVRLDQINTERKRIESDMKQQALQVLESGGSEVMPLAGADLPAAICLYHPDWHQGVVGILASRVKERYHRPVIVFADAGETGEGTAELKGSARSINGLHIRDLLDTLAARYPGMITRFGGHAMAAGLTLPADRLAEFRQALAEEAGRLLDHSALQHSILTDGCLDSAEFCLEIAELLRAAGPWGQGFPEPVFDGDFRVLNQRLLAGKHLKLQVSPDNGRTQLDAIMFNVDTSLWPDASKTQVRLVYRLDINEYRGLRQLQLLVEHINVL